MAAMRRPVQWTFTFAITAVLGLACSSPTAGVAQEIVPPTTDVPEGPPSTAHQEERTPTQAAAEPTAAASAEPVEPTTTGGPQATAERLGARIRSGPVRSAFGPELLDTAGPIAVVVFEESCDGPPADCTTRTNLADASAFQTWITDTVEEPPGIDAATTMQNCNDECCTFSNLARQAAKEELSLPHGLFELRAVCFDVDASGSRRLRRIKLIAY